MPDFRTLARQAAVRNGINPDLFVRQINQESGFQIAPSGRDAQGRILPNGSGAVGIAQIVPKWHPNVDATDPVASLNYAAHLMGSLQRKYGSFERALSAYNSGNPDAYKDPHFAQGQTFNYVKNIMGGAPNMAPASPPASQAPLAPVGLPGAPVPPAPSGGVSRLLAQSLAEGNRMLGLPNIPLPALQGPALRDPTFTASTPTPSPVPGVVGPHVSPVATGYRFGRIDQGVDVSQDRPYVSPGSGTVVRIGPVAGGSNVGVYVRLDHPIMVNGRSYPGIYVWHTSPLVKPGQRVSAGQPIMSPGSAEVGFATASGHPIAPLVGGLGAGTQPTSPGHDMLAFFRAR